MIEQPRLARQHVETDAWHSTRSELPLQRSAADRSNGWVIAAVCTVVFVLGILSFDCARGVLFAATHSVAESAQ